MAKRARKLLSRGPDGPPPPGMDSQRWKKLCDNTRRAEMETGVTPIASEGWEIVAVILMNKIDAARKAGETP